MLPERPRNRSPLWSDGVPKRPWHPKHRHWAEIVRGGHQNVTGMTRPSVVVMSGTEMVGMYGIVMTRGTAIVSLIAIVTNEIGMTTTVAIESKVGQETDEMSIGATGETSEVATIVPLKVIVVRSAGPLEDDVFRHPLLHHEMWVVQPPRFPDGLPTPKVGIEVRGGRHRARLLV